MSKSSTSETTELSPKLLKIFNKLTHPSRNKVPKIEAQKIHDTLALKLLISIGCLAPDTTQSQLTQLFKDLSINTNIRESHKNPYYHALTTLFYLFSICLSGVKLAYENDTPLQSHTFDTTCFHTAELLTDALLKEVDTKKDSNAPELIIALKNTLYLSLLSINMTPMEHKKLLSLITFFYLTATEDLIDATPSTEFNSLKHLLKTWQMNHAPQHQTIADSSWHTIGNQLLDAIPGGGYRKIHRAMSFLEKLILASIIILPTIGLLTALFQDDTIDLNNFSFIGKIGGNLNFFFIRFSIFITFQATKYCFQKSAKKAQRVYRHILQNDLKTSLNFNRKCITIKKQRPVVIITSGAELSYTMQQMLIQKLEQQKSTQAPTDRSDKKRSKRVTRNSLTEEPILDIARPLKLPMEHHPYYKKHILQGVIRLTAIKHIGKGTVSIDFWRQLLNQQRFWLHEISDQRNNPYGTHKIKPFGQSPARLFLRLKEKDIPAGIPKVPYYVATHSRASHV